MGKSLYEHDETMKLLGYQVGVHAGTKADKEICDIITAYVDCEEDSITRKIMQLFQKGFLFGLLSNVYTLGVIAGKRAERAKRKAVRHDGA